VASNTSTEMKSKNPMRRLRLTILLGTLGLTSGCFLVAVGAAGAAGAGTVAYVRGELDATLGSPYSPVVDAAGRAVSQLQFTTVSVSRDAFNAEIIARTAQDKKVDVTVSRQADDLTTIKIRIGLFGNEEESRAILDRIKGNL
jgi:hypothetical protein